MSAVADGERQYEIAYERPADLAGVRAFVKTSAERLGLPGQRAELLILAVSELATNTLQHTAGGGRVRLRVEDGRLLCDVVDAGPLRPLGRRMPAAQEIRGRGLAIVELVCDDVGIDDEDGGTRVRLTFEL
jgi:serine/threonine-protein kinase RsbW